VCGAPFQNGCWEVRGSKSWVTGHSLGAALATAGRGFAGRWVAPRQLRVAASRERPSLPRNSRVGSSRRYVELLRPGDASAAGFSWLRPRSGHDVYRSERKVQPQATEALTRQTRHRQARILSINESGGSAMPGAGSRRSLAPSITFFRSPPRQDLIGAEVLDKFRKISIDVDVAAA